MRRCSAPCFSFPSCALQTQRGLEPEQPQPGADGELGSFYALVIGINDYHAPLPPLKSAVNDAKAVGKVLEEHYGFHVQYLLDAQATRFNILDALGKYESSLQPNDNLVIYYAGHGYLDPNTKRAYWMPYDANSKLSPNRIISDDLMNEVSDAPARHVLVISDSCYSGDLANTRSLGSGPEGGTSAVIQRMLARKSRNLMASGGEETVSDAGADGHSVFASVLLRALSENQSPMYTASSLFYADIKDSVVGNSATDAGIRCDSQLHPQRRRLRICPKRQGAAAGFRWPQRRSDLGSRTESEPAPEPDRQPTQRPTPAQPISRAP